MRTVKCATIVVILTLSAAAAASVAAGQDLSNTRLASSIVRITADPGMLPLNPATVESLILSSGVAGKAARDVLGLDADVGMHIAESINIEWLAQGRQGRGPSQSLMAVPGEPEYGAMIRQMDDASKNRPAPAEPATSESEAGSKESTDQGRQDRLSRADRRSGRDRAGRLGTGMMGGMGGGMGGYGGLGMGMGGFGGMGATGLGGMYGGVTRPQAAGIQQGATIRLSVQLPDDIKPAAEEFLGAIVTNLRETLRGAFERYEGELADLVSQAEGRHESTLEDFARLLGTKPDRTSEGTEIDMALRTVVDLSSLAPDMPLSEAIGLLENSVSPPLQVTVMWRDLLENADLEPDTEIAMDSLSNVELRTALEIMLKAVAAGSAKLTYRIQGNVIVIGTTETIEKPQQRTIQPTTEEVDTRELAARRRELKRNIQAIEMDLASMDARREAIEKQMQITKKELDERQHSDEITRELTRILQTNEELMKTLETSVEAGRVEMAELVKAKEGVLQARIELARRREELAKSGGGGQLSRLSSELSDMAIEKAESQAKLNMLRRQLDETQAQLDQATTFDPRAARIRAAKEAVDAAERRVASLNRRLANLEPPSVTVIGAN